MTKTPYGALNPINGLIDETLGEDSGVYLVYCSDGVNESIDLEAGQGLYSSVEHDQNDQPIDPEYSIAQWLVATISQLERVKAVLLKKYPPKPPTPPTEARIEESELFGKQCKVVILPLGRSVSDCPEADELEDIATADATASQVAGQILRHAGLVGKGLLS